MRAPNDPDYGHHDSRAPPEAALVFAILSRAIQDLFGSIGSTVTATGAHAVRRAALHFWTAETGDAAKDRSLLCSCVGFDGDVMRGRVISILEGDDRPIAAYGGYCDLKNLEEARALWAAGKRHFVEARAAQEARMALKPIPKIKPPPVERPTPDPFDEAAVEADRRDLRALIMQCLAKRPMTKKELYEVTKPAKATAVAAHLYHAERQGHIEIRGYHYEVKTDV